MAFGEELKRREPTRPSSLVYREHVVEDVVRADRTTVTRSLPDALYSRACIVSRLLITPRHVVRYREFAAKSFTPR